MSAAGTPQSKRCPYCGVRRAVGQFRNPKSGRSYERCADCRESALAPQPSDPVRKRVCWECDKEFVTSDFTSRMCSPACRGAHRKRQGDELISARDAQKLTAAMRRLGMGKRKFSFPAPTTHITAAIE